MYRSAIWVITTEAATAAAISPRASGPSAATAAVPAVPTATALPRTAGTFWDVEGESLSTEFISSGINLHPHCFRGEKNDHSHAVCYQYPANTFPSPSFYLSTWVISEQP